MSNITELHNSSEAEAESPGYREMPNNIEAEQALLGAILVDNRVFESITGYLRADHFFQPVHGRIYDACRTLVERGQVANPVTLNTYFANDPALQEVGGAGYLGQLGARAVTLTHADHYGKIIYDLALRRQLVDIGEGMREEAYNAPLDQSALDQIEKSEQQLFNLAEDGEADRGFTSFKDALIQSLASTEAAQKIEGGIAGINSGFSGINKMMGGLHRSDLIILAGRPAMGKTALATNMAFNVAKWYRDEHERTGTPMQSVAFFSLEMSSEQLAQRILASEAEVDSNKLRRGGLHENEFDALVRATQEIESLPLFIDDTPALPISAARSRARRLKRQHGLGLVVIDYVQLMRPSGTQRTDNRVQEISEITQGLKALAKELDVPVIALSQVNRGVEQREDKRPQMSDLRESGSIEQDADVVMFVYRDEYYLQQKEPPTHEQEKHEEWKMAMDRVHNKAELIIGKQRHGPVGTIEMTFIGARTKFGDYIPPDHLPEQTY